MQKFIFDPNPGQQRNKISFGVWKKQMTQDAYQCEIKKKELLCHASMIV
jgi:hypothetical protein